MTFAGRLKKERLRLACSDPGNALIAHWRQVHNNLAKKAASSLGRATEGHASKGIVTLPVCGRPADALQSSHGDGESFREAIAPAHEFSTHPHFASIRV
jgi:hypothetical protein